MRLVLFEGPGAGKSIRPGVWTDAGVVDVSAATAELGAHSPQHLMEQVIDGFDALRPAFERLANSGLPLPLDVIRLRPPLPRPGKILACIGNYWEHEQREARPLNMFLKNSDAVIGPSDTVVLPEFTEPYMFQHEAELAIVMRGPAKSVKAADWRRAVFGYTGMIDVSARGEGRFTWRRGSWMGKSFDTFAPLGPCITTADEITEPNKLWVKFWNNGDLRHDYVTDDMEHTVPELVEWATTIMTMNSGDVIACGTNHEGLGPMQDGELCEIELEKIGRMAVHVRDPLKRQWERGIYMGPNSTNPAARRARGDG
ncbi:MAG TPA: fumarylacetoacetate hydrolase family protein [Chloroflexota bacterium]|jgi:2-keto-4-pentenoate hydratase/2-oxohepta-3-ene-1,7-dioic acid hydratase in catechol pathway